MQATTLDLILDDVIDSRELQDLLEDAEDRLADHEDGSPLTDEELAETTRMVETLRRVVDEVGSEWVHGVTLIAEDYFVEYAKDLLDDIGEIPRNLPSYIVIDWKQTADNLRVDYAEVEIEGFTYLFHG